MSFWVRFFPFLRWFPYQAKDFKADTLAGITGALVLVPQSMAYAQLAGLPAYYGLYASFVPVAIAALWGTSSQLGSGPVAVVSLLTASSLATFAVSGSDQYIALAVSLALMVGLVQLLLGVFRLGVVVNFLSHPVIVGFTNASVIVIALSQLPKIFGVPTARSEHFIADVLGVFGQIGTTHGPTLAMGGGALFLLWALRKYAPRWPGVLTVVVLGTLISWAAGFERNARATIDQVADPELRALLLRVDATGEAIHSAGEVLTQRQSQHIAAEKAGGSHGTMAVVLAAEVELARLRVKQAEARLDEIRYRLHRMPVRRVVDANGETAAVYLDDRVPPGALVENVRYRIVTVKQGAFVLRGGGEVVGPIPAGLPAPSLPQFSLETLGGLLSAACMIALVGFVGTISVVKAMAAKTRERVNPDQELVAQGLSNLAGAFFQAFPVAGSLSRSALNLQNGARTGMTSVITAGVVMLTLLFLTASLYSLPQAVLAAIIIVSVVGLLDFDAIRQAWRVNRHDGLAAVLTFVATLLYAPYLERGILLGAGLSVGLFLVRTMTPYVVRLAWFPDGRLREVRVGEAAPENKGLLAVRFDGQLYFANVAYFEDSILEAVADHPEARFLLVVGGGINRIDASGEEVIRHLVERLSDSGITVIFSALKKPVLDAMRATGLYERIGKENIFADKGMALEAISARLA